MSQHDSPFADQLTIDTPEQVALALPLAGVGSRLLAILADSLLQLAALLVLALLIFLVLTAAPGLAHATSAVAGWSGTAQKWLVAGFILVQFLLFWGYFSLFEAFWNGQTPGKRLLRIRVLSDTGRPIDLFEALARNLLRIIDMVPSIYLVGLVTMLCNRQQKRLGDLLAGTLVVHEGAVRNEPLRAASHRMLSIDAVPARPPAFASGAFAMAAPDPSTPPVPADALARLGLHDLQVLETFFTRYLDLSLEVRHAVALRVASQLTATMQWAPAGWQSAPERLLDQVLAGLRNR